MIDSFPQSLLTCDWNQSLWFGGVWSPHFYLEVKKALSTPENENFIHPYVIRFEFCLKNVLALKAMNWVVYW